MCYFESMKKINLVPLLSLLLLASCDGFESGDVSSYTGNYLLETANEKTYHVAWGNKSLTSERNLSIDIKSMTINEDKSVEYIKNDGTSHKGTIKVYEDYCKFSSTPIDSSYKFSLRYDHALYYSYESSHFGVEYDVTYINVTFKLDTKIDDKGGIKIVRKEDDRYKTDYVIGMTTFDIVVTNSDGTINSDIKRGNVRWSVGDTSIATVDSAGDVTPKKGGETTLTVTHNQYSDTITIKTAIFAPSFSYDSSIKNYFVGKTYDMPVITNKDNATVYYTIDDESVISISGNKFSCLYTGTVNVNAKAFTSIWGDMEELDFVIEVKDKNAPYFKFNDTVSTSGTGTVTKNKYSEIPYASLGIKAYSNQDVELTSMITVKSGSYDLTRAGKYNVILTVQDPTYAMSSDFALTLTVIEYETRKTLSPYDALVIDSSSYELVDEPYSYAIRTIRFNLRVSLNSKYDASDAKVICFFYFSIENWGRYRTYDYLGDGLTSVQYFELGGPRTLTFELEFSKGVDLHPETFVYEGSMAAISGYVYNYTYY